MLNKIYRWFVKYDVEICWFLTGWFASEFFHDFAVGNWFGAIIDLILVIVNISFYKK